MIEKLKNIVDLKQRKKIKVLSLMLGDKCKEIYLLKREVKRVTELANSIYSEKSALKVQVDDYQEAIAEKDMLINNLQNPSEN